jgi:putative salt-induced outer membrane protein YdiY
MIYARENVVHKYLFLILLMISRPGWAVDPFEDFHEYGQLSDEEIHELHKGEMLYGDTEFGFILSKGNTNSTSFKLKGNLYQDFENWRNQFKIDSLYKRDQNDDTGQTDVTANRVFVSAQGNYKVGVKNASFFIYGDYEEDEFSGLDFKSTIATGYGARVYQGVKNKVDIDIGPGVYRSVADDESEVSEDEINKTGYLLRVAMQWERLVSKRTRFNQDVSIEQSLSGLNSRLKSETALISQVIGAVSLKFAYMYRYNSKPEDDKLKFDSELSATLVYSF